MILSELFCSITLPIPMGREQIWEFRLRPNAYVEEWLKTYSKANGENDPKVSAKLFPFDADPYETPFDKPIIGREAIYQC